MSTNSATDSAARRAGAVPRDGRRPRGDAERLFAEYLTLATEAQAECWDALLARSGLSDDVSGSCSQFGIASTE
jgi:hypothetical protein